MISDESENDAPYDEISVSNEKQNGKESESKRDQNESPVDDNGCGCWSITKQCIKYCCMVVLYILLPLVPAILSFLILIICAPYLIIWIILPFAKFFPFVFIKFVNLNIFWMFLQLICSFACFLLVLLFYVLFSFLHGLFSLLHGFFCHLLFHFLIVFVMRCIRAISEKE